MHVDFDLLESAPIRAVLRVLGPEDVRLWPIRDIPIPRKIALCTGSRLLTMAEEPHDRFVYPEAWFLACADVGRPAFDGRFLCTAHAEGYHPCVTCGRRPVWDVHPGQRCLWCVELELRQRLREGPVPQRFQWRRVKGARTPVHAQDVTRTSHWGNPFEVVHQRALLGKGYRPRYKNKALAEAVVRLFEAYYEHDAPFREAVQLCLAGVDLKCFCPLDWPCHGDVLLRWANVPR